MGKIKGILEKENTMNLLILCIAAILVCLPLLNQDLNIGYDDGVQHISRLIGTYQSIEEGQVFPVIMSKFCNGFGYSWNLFYSPVTAYVPLIFKLLGVSFTACIKLFMLAVTILSAITMYFFTKEITKNKKIAVIAGIFYIFAPYRLNDMYIRNALAELTSFVFLPMVFERTIWSVKEKAKKRIFTNHRKCWTTFNTYRYYDVYRHFLRNLFIDTDKSIKKQKNKKEDSNFCNFHHNDNKLFLGTFIRT